MSFKSNLKNNFNVEKIANKFLNFYLFFGKSNRKNLPFTGNNEVVLEWL